MESFLQYALFFFVALLGGSLAFSLPSLVRDVLPYTVLVLILSTLFFYFLKQTDSFPEAVLGQFTPESIQIVFLPPLIFSDLFKCNVHIFTETLSQALLLAFPGVILGTAIIALFPLYMAQDQSNVYTSFAFGGLMSATDPVAVVAILGELGASKRLASAISGESILNDGSGIVIVTLFLNLANDQKYDALGIFDFAMREVFGALAIGVAFGLAALGCFWLLQGHAEPLTAITIVLPYLCFVLCVSFLELSGVLSLVPLGLLINTFGPACGVVGTTLARMSHFWETLEFVANTLLFSLSGLLIATDIEREFLTLETWGLLLLLYVFVNVVRLFCVFALYPILRRLGYGLSFNDAIFMSWAGLRGAVGLTLAITIRESDATGEQEGARFLFYTAGVVVLTAIINATTSSVLVRKLGLTRPLSPDVLGALKIRMWSAVKGSLKYAGLSRAGLSFIRESFLSVRDQINNDGRTSESFIWNSPTFSNANHRNDSIDQDSIASASVRSGKARFRHLNGDERSVHFDRSAVADAGFGVGVPDSPKMTLHSTDMKIIDEDAAGDTQMSSEIQKTHEEFAHIEAGLRNDASEGHNTPRLLADERQLLISPANDICVDIEEDSPDAACLFRSIDGGPLFGRHELLDSKLVNRDVLRDKRRYFLLAQQQCYDQLLERGVLSRFAHFVLCKAGDATLDLREEENPSNAALLSSRPWNRVVSELEKWAWLYAGTEEADHDNAAEGLEAADVERESGVPKAGVPKIGAVTSDWSFKKAPNHFDEEIVSQKHTYKPSASGYDNLTSPLLSLSPYKDPWSLLEVVFGPVLEGAGPTFRWCCGGGRGRLFSLIRCCVATRTYDRWFVLQIGYISYGFLRAHEQARRALHTMFAVSKSAARRDSEVYRLSTNRAEHRRANSSASVSSFDGQLISTRSVSGAFTSFNFNRERRALEAESYHACKRAAKVLDFLRCQRRETVRRIKAQQLAASTQWKLFELVARLSDLGVIDEQEAEVLMDVALELVDEVRGIDDLPLSNDRDAIINSDCSFTGHPDFFPFQRSSRDRGGGGRNERHRGRNRQGSSDTIERKSSIASRTVQTGNLSKRQDESMADTAGVNATHTMRMRTFSSSGVVRERQQQSLHGKTSTAVSGGEEQDDAFVNDDDDEESLLLDILETPDAHGFATDIRTMIDTRSLIDTHTNTRARRGSRAF